MGDCLSIYMCFVDLERACNCVPKRVLRGALHEYGVLGLVIWAIQSYYNLSESFILSTSSSMFLVWVGLQLHNIRIVALLYTDDVVSSVYDVQQALRMCAAAYEAVRIRVSPSKSDAMVPC